MPHPAAILAANVRSTAPAYAFALIHALDLSYCHMHVHRTCELVLHPSGRGVTKMGDGKAIAFAPGDAVFYPPHERHDQQLSEPGEDLIIQFDVAGPLPSRSFLLAGSVDAHAAGLARMICRQTASTPSGRSAGGYLVAALILALCERADPSAGEGLVEEGHAARARRIIAERYRDLGRLEEVADELGIGHDHLRHLFRAAYGISLVGWLTEVRLARARELLTRTPLPLAEVARQVGWPNERYLCGVFRRNTGMTPTTWRRRG
jgi:AraC-like DNA-binding protein